MRIITCAGYYATGSSAVTDYFGEFGTVLSLDKYEYRFVQDPDTISDLEYNIIENNHRHNTSDAIKRFKKMMRSLHGFNYRHTYDIFGEAFDMLTDNYINDITELKTRSWWHIDRIRRGTIFTIADMAYSFLKRIFTGGLHTEKRYSLLKHIEYGYYSSITEKEFLDATRKFTTKLFESVNKENKPFIMVDQLVPPTNVSRYVRYFDDIKVVVVERDPRDVYLVEKTKIMRGVIPTDNVEDYVKWYKITRKYSGMPEDPERVIKIHFEDLIYKYDETTDMLRDFIGLSEADHKRKKELLNPDRSIQNTNLKNKIHGHEAEIKYIEENLSEYLYTF